MGMKMRQMLLGVAAGLLGLAGAVDAADAVRPNIVFVLCDDLGYGDVHCLNPERGRIATPSVDRLAREGMVFTDAHSGSAVCSPTRYGLLTGRYSWRTRLQRGVVQGFSPCLIAPDRLTVAGFLQQQGYHTAIVGKWHLDFQYADAASGRILKRTKRKALAPVGSVIPDGPVSRGFDFYHGFHHAGDMQGVIENDRVIAHEDEIHMLPRLVRESVEYIDGRAKDAKGEPFFLYVPFGSPHAPILPTDEWRGKSGINAYADFVMQTDAGFGEILDALDRNGLSDNTLVIFSSDNGCSKVANFEELEKAGHFASGHLRGSKSDIWDGGHRVPFVVRWPGKVKAGSVSDQLICLTDFFATVAEVTGGTVPAGSGEDSVSFLPALAGGEIESTRKGVVHHSISGHFAYRMGKWKLCLAKGSGGWSAPNEKAAKGAPVAQLYDMEKDPGETTNLYKSHPEVAERLLKQLEADVTGGRSTAGVASANDVSKIVLWKSGGGAAKASYTPEAGSQAEMKRGSWAVEPDPALPNVLILGDSISIGYTQQVRAALAGEANVFRPCSADGRKPENCQGTANGVKEIDRWLAGRKWDVIHFNWGLHDLKHVKAGSGKNSNSFDDPRQAEPEAYRKNLAELVGKLKATGAQLIFATTTPYPAGVKPARLPADAALYNEIALEIMADNGVAVNDLHGVVDGRLNELQLPKNVHFKGKGNAVMSERVAGVIAGALKKKAGK